MGAIEKLKVAAQTATNGTTTKSTVYEEARTEIENANRNELNNIRALCKDAIADLDVYIPLWERELTDLKERLAKFEGEQAERRESRAELTELLSLCEKRLTETNDAAGEE